MADPGKMSNEKALKLAATLEDIDDEANPGLRQKVLKTLADHGFPQTTDAKDTGFGGARIVDPGLKQEPNVIVQPEPAKVGFGEAVGLGAVQGATLGYGEEVEAGLLSLADRVPRLMGRTIDAEVDPRTPYQASVDELRDRLDLAQSEQPGGYMIGEAGAGIAPGLVASEAVVLKRLKLLGRSADKARKVQQAKKAKVAQEGFKTRVGAAVKEGSIIGAGLGAVTGYGMSELDQGIGNVLTNVAGQTVMGGLGGVAGGVIGEGVSEIARGMGRSAQRGLLDQSTRGAKGVEYARAMEGGASPQTFGAPQGLNHGEAMAEVYARTPNEVSATEVIQAEISDYLLPVIKKEKVDLINAVEEIREDYYASVGGGAPINLMPIADDVKMLKDMSEAGVFSEAQTSKLQKLYKSLFSKPEKGESIGTAAEQAVGKVTGIGDDMVTFPGGVKRDVPKGSTIRELDIKSFDDSIKELSLMIKDAKHEAGTQAKLKKIRESMYGLRKKTHEAHAANMEEAEQAFELMDERIDAMGMNSNKDIKEFIIGENPEEAGALINSVNAHGKPGNANERNVKEINRRAKGDPKLRQMLSTNAGLRAVENIRPRTEMGMPGRIVASPAGGASGYVALAPGEQVAHRVAGMQSASGRGASKLGGAMAASIDRDLAQAMTARQMEEFYDWVVNAQADGRDLNPDDFERGMRQ